MPDYSFISVAPASGFTALRDLLGVAGAAQQLQSGGLSLQKQRETLQSEIERAKAESRRTAAEANVAEGTAQPRIQRAQTESEKSSLELTDKRASILRNAAGALFRDPAIQSGDPAKIHSALASQFSEATRSGVPTEMALHAFGELSHLANDPPRLLEKLRTINQQEAGGAQRASVINAPLTPVQNGQRTTFAQTQPGAPNAVQQGQYIQHELPPTTPVFDPQSNAPGYLGPQPPGATAQPRPGSAIQSGPALGVKENIGGTVETVNKDWDTTAAAARTAAQDIGVLQEIKKYAKGAVTGVTSDRRAFIVGLAGVLGMSDADIKKTDTDLLAKNAAMLAKDAGNTDAQRILNEMSNPNSKMTEEAILKAANQVAAQRQMALLRQQVLAPHKDNAQAYSNAMAQFNLIADPRVLQLPLMSAEEKAKMKAAMSPQEQKDFRHKIEILERNGWLR